MNALAGRWRKAGRPGIDGSDGGARYNNFQILQAWKALRILQSDGRVPIDAEQQFDPCTFSMNQGAGVNIS